MVKSWMQLRDDFEYEDRLLNYLSSQLLKGRLSLVLGSGISSAFNLPLWPTLIEILYEDKGAIPPSGMSITRKAEYFRTAYFKNDYIGFVDSVRKTLYKDVDVSFEKLVHPINEYLK